MSDDQKRGSGFKSLADALAETLPNLPAIKAEKAVAEARRATERKPLTPVQRRLLGQLPDADHDNDPDALAFQHSVFCQTGLPYRDLGADVRLWQRTQGAAFVEIQAGRMFDPDKNTTVEVGLPWGTKSRLVLTHLNAEALRQGKNVIEIEGSLTAFVKRIRGFTGGREIKMFKEHLNRLSAASILLAYNNSNVRASQINTKIITACDLWLSKDDRQRVFWPSIIALSLDYFESLQQHAVPLNESDLAALAHSAMALDIYSWLAQRLHRIDPARPQFITWAGIKGQFGPDFVRMNKFKEKFRLALRQVLARYQSARLEADDRGLTLFNSPPPVKSQLVLASRNNSATAPPAPTPRPALTSPTPMARRKAGFNPALIERMRQMPEFDGWDLGWLETEFCAWLAKPDKAPPRDYGAALIGWARKYVANHPLRS